MHGETVKCDCSRLCCYHHSHCHWQLSTPRLLMPVPMNTKAVFTLPLSFWTYPQ